MTEQTDPILVDNVSITSTTEAEYDVLNAGDNVSVTATFSESVIVTDDDGIGVDNASSTPTLTIVVGSDNRTATYASGSTSTALVFQYTIQPGDNDTNGISIGADALALNSGTIRDASGNYATITHGSWPDNSSYIVDNTGPILVDNVSITSGERGGDGKLHPDGNLPSIYGAEFSVTATFNENVTVTGSPYLIAVVNSDNRTASFDSGDNSTELIFTYTLVYNVDTTNLDGIRILGDSLNLNGGTIKDAAGNEATITHSANSNTNKLNWPVK